MAEKFPLKLADGTVINDMEELKKYLSLDEGFKERDNSEGNPKTNLQADEEINRSGKQGDSDLNENMMKPDGRCVSSQEELDCLVNKMRESGEEGAKIFLIRNEYILPLDLAYVTYIGLDHPKVKFEGNSIAGIDVRGCMDAYMELFQIELQDVDYDMNSDKKGNRIHQIRKIIFQFKENPQEIQPLLEEMAEKENTTAQLALGIALAHGWGWNIQDAYKRTEESEAWLIRAADHGDAEALYLAGLFRYYAPNVGYSDRERAVEWMEKAVSQGNERAQFLLDRIYCCDSHYRDKLDKQEKVQWLEKAAEMGVPQAQRELGNIHDWSEAEAGMWLEKAARQGELEARSYLLLYYCEDVDYMENNEDEVIRLAKELYDDGHYFDDNEWVLDEMFFDYIIHHCGSDKHALQTGAFPDIKELQKRARKGDAEAQYDIGCLFCAGNGSDNPRGLKWLQKAAQQGHAGALYQIGCKCAKNEYEKVMWLERAADGGSIDALYELSKSCEDEEKRIMWLTKAANQGHRNAQYELGRYYLSDVNNEEEGIRWLEEAADQGDWKSVQELVRYYLSDIHVAENGIEWLEQAAEQGSIFAQFALGWIYCYRMKNEEKALDYWEKAANKGDERSLFELGLF